MSLGALFTYIATFGGSLLGLINPFFGLLVYVMFAVLRPDELWSYSLPTGNYSKIVAIATLIGWGLRGFGKWDLGRTWPVILCLLGYVGWSLVSFALFGLEYAESLTQIDLTIKFAIPVMVGVSTIRSWRQMQVMIWVIVGSYGFVAYEMNLAYYMDGYNRILLAGHGGADNNCAAVGFVGATAIAMALVFESRQWWLKWFSLVLVAMMVNTIFLSGSRGGMVSLGVASLVLFALIPKKTAHYVVMIAMIAIGGRLAGPTVIERFSTMFASEGLDASAESRIKLWQDALTVAVENPVLGVGPGLWGLQSSRFGWAKGKAVHSLWCQTAAEVGFVGVGLLLAVYLLPLYEIWRCKRVGDQYQVETPLAQNWRMIAPSLLGMITGLQFVSVTNLELPYFLVMLGCCAVIIDQNDYHLAMKELDETADDMSLDESATPVGV